LHAELAARELGRLHLANALALLVLIAKENNRRFEPAALLWHSRFVQEAKTLDFAEAQLVLAALAALRNDDGSALKVITRIARRHGVRGFTTGLQA